MKLVTYLLHETPRLGALIEAPDRTVVVDALEAAQRRGFKRLDDLRSMQALIESGRDGLAALRELVGRVPASEGRPLASVRLLAPLPLPEQIRDCLCFEAHLTQIMARAEAAGGSASPAQQAMLQTLRQRPIYYKANRFAVVGPDVDVVWPSYSQVMDYELEMAAVIGKRGKNLTPEAVGEHLFGFTIFNDLSARDQQAREMPGMLGPTKSKDFDGANVIGPCIVTADAFDHRTAPMRVRVNGELRSEGTSASMSLSFEDLIAYISRDETLHPGELICSGTVGGGCGAELGRLLTHGDVVELEIAGIGVLRTRVLAQADGCV